MADLSNRQLRTIAKTSIKTSLNLAIDAIDEHKTDYTESEYNYLLNTITEYNIYLRKVIDSMI